MRLTSNASEEDIKKLKLIEVPVEISRQAGKTTCVVLTVEFMLTYFPKLFNRRIFGEIFAPQIEQAKTDFDRLKEALMRVDVMYKVVENQENPYKDQNNAKTIVLPNGSGCYISPVMPTSKPESKTPDFMIFEESQDISDKIMKEQIWPMGAATNAPRFYIGTAGTKLCYFRSLGQGKDAIKLYFDEITKQRRITYEETQDVRHLIYERTVNQEIEKHGLESDEIQRPYFGKWLIGTGQFTTEENIEALVQAGANGEGQPRLPTFHYKKGECFAGIDTAKHPDSTVVTIIRYNKETKRKDLLNWLELRGENYQDQFENINYFLSNYNVVAIAIDSTGQGDFMPDMFENNTEWTDENSGLYRVKFSAVSKDLIYKNLKVTIQELLTTLPNLSTKLGERFRQEILDLQQKYNGQLLSVSHPDDANAHDDYPDSWALAEWAYAKWNEANTISVDILSSEKARKVKKDRSGNVTDYWPGLYDEM